MDTSEATLIKVDGQPSHPIGTVIRCNFGRSSGDEDLVIVGYGRKRDKRKRVMSMTYVVFNIDYWARAHILKRTTAHAAKFIRTFSIEEMLTAPNELLRQHALLMIERKGLE